MPDRGWEVGAGVAQVTPRPYVDETAASAGQLWVSGQVARDRIALTAIAPFDDDAAGFGGALRFNAIDVGPFNAGVEGELGYLWLGLSTPLSLRIIDQSHVYTAPRLFNWSRDLSFGIPVGVSVRVYDGFILRAEWQRSWQDFKYYNRRDHYGGALAVQF
ncbi:MAG TPA: hypothetical protein PKA88_13550 [Polyangiaceae bacterium]|nr:hypothetical protein [Polyangiaceae bacterium]